MVFFLPNNYDLQPDNVALALPNLRLTPEEKLLIERMLENMQHYELRNRVKEAYYEGKQTVRNLGIAVPSHMANLEMVVGWAATAVDVLDERLDWQGWTSDTGNDFGLGQVYLDNELGIESAGAHLDALLYGTSFMVVGTGFEGEPNPLVTVESARNMTGLYDNRTHRLKAALGVNRREDGVAVEVTLYLPNANLYCEFRSGIWSLVDKDEHNLGRVLVAQMFNRVRASKRGGTSEITPAIRSYVDQGVRTMFGMELNREFYSTPQRYMLGADMSAFTDADGNQLTGWEAIMGHMLAIGKDEDGEKPTVGQFTAASPAPYIEQLQALKKEVAAEAGIPVSYLGIVTSNPSSADAIRQEEIRLIKRAEKRQMVFGRTYLELGRIVLTVQEGSIPDNYSEIGAKWRDAATPTRSASADEAVKLVGSGVLPNDSSVTYDRIGLSPQEQRQLESDKRKANATQRIADIRAAVAGTEVADDNTSAG